ncbi:unnamed protein product, partial [Ectocarpus sp. 12 AP-2014]
TRGGEQQNTAERDCWATASRRNSGGGGGGGGGRHGDRRRWRRRKHVRARREGEQGAGRRQAIRAAVRRQPCHRAEPTPRRHRGKGRDGQQVSPPYRELRARRRPNERPRQ